MTKVFEIWKPMAKEILPFGTSWKKIILIPAGGLVVVLVRGQIDRLLKFHRLVDEILDNRKIVKASPSGIKLSNGVEILLLRYEACGRGRKVELVLY